MAEPEVGDAIIAAVSAIDTDVRLVLAPMEKKSPRASFIAIRDADGVSIKGADLNVPASYVLSVKLTLALPSTRALALTDLVNSNKREA